MTQGAGCIWCGGKPVTKEDAIPQRFMKHLLAGDKRALLGVAHRTGQGQPTARPMRWIKTKAMEANCVCGPCNRGWMAIMDKEAAPYLQLMMAGFSISLEDKAKETLAVWATKVAIMLSYATQDYPGIDDSYLQWIYGHKKPLASARVWLAAYAGGLTGVTFVKHVMLTEDNGDVRHDENGTPYAGHLIGFILGFLVVMVWIWEHPVHEASPVPFHNVRANFTHQIWPTGIIDLVWPPQAVLDIRGFYALTMTDPEMVKICLSVNPPTLHR